MSAKNDTTQALRTAIDNDDKYALQYLLSSKELTKESKGGALYHAIEVNNPECAHCLLRRRAPVNFRGKRDITPLILASRHGHTRSVELLLQYRASVLMESSRGFTALDAACRGGHYQCAQLLINAGAKVDYRGVYGFPPLYYAIKYGKSLDIVKMLVDQKVTQTFRNSKSTATMLAIEMGANGIATYLIDRNYIPGQFASLTVLSERVLSHAIKLNNEYIIKYVLDRADGEEVAKKVCDAEKGTTPLILACHVGRRSVCQLLLHKGASVNAQDNDGVTPLLVAINGGHASIVDDLLEAGADVNLSSHKHDLSPLISAVGRGHADIVKSLLEHGGCDVDKKDTTDEGETASHWACKRNNVHIVELLLEAGADPNIPDKNNLTTLHKAAQYNSVEIVKFLLNAGMDVEMENADAPSPLVIAASYSAQETFDFLLEQGASPNRLDKHSRFPLEYMLKTLYEFHLNLEGAAMLLRAGADVNQRTKRFGSIAERCARSGNVSLLSLKLLLPYKPRLTRAFHFLINNKTNISNDVFSQCMKCEVYPCLKRESLLYREVEDTDYPYNNPPNVGVRAEYTPLMAAISTGKVDLAKFFLSTWFLHLNDVKILPRMELRSSEIPTSEIEEETAKLKQTIFCQPWALACLSFVTVSTLLGAGDERRQMVEQLGVPPAVKRKLLFEDDSISLPPSQWDAITLETIHRRSV